MNDPVRVRKGNELLFVKWPQWATQWSAHWLRSTVVLRNKVVTDLSRLDLKYAKVAVIY